MNCAVCGHVTNPECKNAAVTGAGDLSTGFTMKIHCKHTDNPPDGAVILSSPQCIWHWFQNYLALNMVASNELTSIAFVKEIQFGIEFKLRITAETFGDSSLQPLIGHTGALQWFNDWLIRQTECSHDAVQPKPRLIDDRQTRNIQ